MSEKEIAMLRTSIRDLDGLYRELDSIQCFISDLKEKAPAHTNCQLIVTSIHQDIPRSWCMDFSNHYNLSQILEIANLIKTDTLSRIAKKLEDIQNKKGEQV